MLREGLKKVKYPKGGEGRPAQQRPIQVGQIFTLIGFGPANCSQIFDGYEFTSKISRQI